MDDMYLFKSQDEGNRLLYAYYKGEFWFYDPNVQQWYISGHVREQYELEAQKDVSLTPDDFTCTGYGYEFLAEYEVPVAVLDALRRAKKVLPPEPAGVEVPETADEGREPEDGFPDWELPMVKKILTWPWMPKTAEEFTSSFFKSCDAVRAREGGSCAAGLYDTGPQGIKFSKFNQDVRLYAEHTWADFVRRCKAAGLAPEQLHQDKEESTCNTEPPAPTGDAAATTAASAAVSTAETSTTSESGAGANSCRPPATAAQPNSEPHAELAPTAPTSLPAFDYAGLDADTAEHLQNLARRAAQAKQRYILDMMGIVVEAHRELVAPCDKHNNQHSEATFRAWCASIGVGKDTAYRLLQVQALMDGSTPEEQEVLADAPAKLLYAAAKPSAPAELVQAVKDGDITTHKQYQKALARIRTLENQNASLLHSYETERGKADAADRRAEEESRKRKEANEGYAAVMETLRQAQEDAANADARARAAEHDRDEARKERDGARDALQAVKLRGDRLKAENDDLKARPIEAAVVDEDELDRRVEERVRRQMADREADRQQQAARNAEDAILLLGRQINTAWQMVRPFLAEMEENSRVDAVDRINKQWAQTQKEIMSCL